MRKTLAAVLFALLPFQSPYAQSGTKPAISQIEQELGKWHPSVVSLFRTDYTTGQAGISFSFSPKERWAEGVYNLETGGVELPVESGGSLRAATQGAIDHEIAHALFHTVLFNPSRYAGPSQQEMEACLAKRFEDPEFRAARQQEEAAAPLIAKLHFVLNSDGLINAKSGFVLLQETAITGLMKLYKDTSNPGAGQEAQDLEQSLDAMQHGLKKVEQQLAEWGKITKTLGLLRHASLTMGGTVQSAVDHAIDLDQTLSQLIEHGYRAMEMVNEQIHSRAGNAPTENNRYLKFKRTVLKKVQSVLPMMKTSAKEVLAKYLREPNPHLSALDSFSERFARAVDSLMSQYHGKTTLNYLPLSERELALFERMTVDGSPIFRDAVRFYRIGQARVKNGEDPAQVQRDLQYAITARYKGATVTRARTPIRLKGAIPSKE